MNLTTSLLLQLKEEAPMQKQAEELVRDWKLKKIKKEMSRIFFICYTAIKWPHIIEAAKKLGRGWES